MRKDLAHSRKNGLSSVDLVCRHRSRGEGAGGGLRRGLRDAGACAPGIRGALRRLQCRDARPGVSPRWPRAVSAASSPWRSPMPTTGPRRRELRAGPRARCPALAAVPAACRGATWRRACARRHAIILADHRLRLNGLVDPAENPLFVPAKYARRAARCLCGRRETATASRLHTPTRVDRWLFAAGLEPEHRTSIGFGAVDISRAAGPSRRRSPAPPPQPQPPRRPPGLPSAPSRLALAGPRVRPMYSARSRYAVEESISGAMRSAGWAWMSTSALGVIVDSGKGPALLRDVS